MVITATNIGYIHSDSRWEHKGDIHNQIDSYYSDIRDILQATASAVPQPQLLNHTHALAVIQTKKVFKIPGYPNNSNYVINEETGEFIE